MFGFIGSIGDSFVMNDLSINMIYGPINKHKLAIDELRDIRQGGPSYWRMWKT